MNITGGLATQVFKILQFQRVHAVHALHYSRSPKYRPCVFCSACAGSVQTLSLDSLPKCVVCALLRFACVGSSDLEQSTVTSGTNRRQQASTHARSASRRMDAHRRGGHCGAKRGAERARSLSLLRHKPADGTGRDSSGRTTRVATATTGTGGTHAALYHATVLPPRALD
jgi:hypothetical protein